MPVNDFEDVFTDDINERIEKLKQRARQLCGPEMTSDVAAECPPEVEEQFWQQVIAYHEAEEAPLFDVLLKSGVSLPPPQQMNDAQLTVKLWEVIRAMAALGAFLEFTDHLSDRELYARLWNDVLREPTMLMPEDPAFACHIDMIGTGSEEDTALYLKYFADENARRDWAIHFPEETIPRHENLPHDRDRHLPKPHEESELVKQ
ncbi:MAG: hypothetical protein PHX83_12430 [Acidobacteriia bacterium]|nr:hypothetical protein [Terriglobia bacterium]